MHLSEIGTHCCQAQHGLCLNCGKQHCSHAGWSLQCREGQEGDNFYVIEEGVFKATKMVGPSRKELFTYEHHGAFGELAMMYNCPRAATVEVSS